MKSLQILTIITFAVIHSAAGSAITRSWNSTTITNVQQAAVNTTELETLLFSLQDFNAHNLGPNFAMGARSRSSHFDLLEKRSDFPLLDTILSTLNNTGVALSVIDFVLLRPELLDIVIQTTIWVIRLRLINLTDLLIVLQRSNLILEVLTLGLEDAEILPGLINITVELLKQSGSDLGLLSKRLEDDAFEGVRSSQISKRENALLDQLFISLRESGLAASVVKHLLTTPELAAPNAHFLVSILQSHALSLGELLTALKESNLIWDLIRQLLGDPSIIIDFGGIIVQRVAQGIIPKSLIPDT
ncbi:hypothetical protein CANMA_004078 [Candida margitis]|uniref:uncharacterized protein n=1 Tax=Candida margitis TaxID=1775924 RepID=UPI002225CAED|nr:uncharacterized protein CANMA_004078 [Candida margitis]KAI5959978.1 hypothetical protein CANMA_004078 [Candida margitis]